MREPDGAGPVDDHHGVAIAREARERHLLVGVGGAELVVGPDPPRARGGRDRQLGAEAAEVGADPAELARGERRGPALDDC